MQVSEESAHRTEHRAYSIHAAVTILDPGLYDILHDTEIFVNPLSLP
jgi:hypothetical protein